MKHTHLASSTPLEIPSLTARRAAAFMRRLLSWVSVCLWWCLLFSSASAQNVKHTQNNTDSALRSDFRVDPTTLGLGFQLTIGNYPGRAGTGLPITLSYSSKLWRMNAKDTYGAPYSAIPKTRTEAKYAEYSAAGWTTNFDLPRLEGLEWLPYDYTGAGICILPSCVQENSESATFYVYRMMAHMPDGSAHELRKDDTPFTTHTAGGIYYAVDGSQMRYDAGADVLYLPDGSRYLNPANIANGVQYIDRNGNTLSYNNSTRQWTDTLGRVISRPPLDSTQAGDFSYTVKGVGGVDLTYTLRWRYLSDVRTPNVQTNTVPPLRYAGDRTMNLPLQPVLSPSLFDSTAEEVACTASGQVFNPIVLYQVVLPNGRAYTFTYNVWGEIDKVVYPTGAYERYRYDKIGGISDSYYENDVYRQTNRGVVERWVSVTGDGTDEGQQHWQYSASNNNETTPYTVVITAPDGSRTERLLKGPQGDTRFGFEHVLNARSYEERVYSASGQMLRRTLTDWTSSGPLPGGEWSATRDARVTKQVEILLDTGGNALSATTTFEYDSDINLTATHRYGYVAVDQATAQTGAISSFALGTLLRTEETTYLVNDPNIDATTRAAYRARNFLSLPTSTRVKDGAGATLAQTAISYDEAAYPLLTYSNVTNWTDPQTSVRALATTQSAWLNTTNTWLQSHVQYDQFGNVRKTWDARGNVSEVQYSSSYNYSYPTHTISPIPDIGNSFCSTTALETSTVYDFSTGLVTSSTDANGKTTTLQYNDVLNRPTAVLRPDGGRTTYTYVDAHQCGPYVETRTLLDTSGRETDDYVFFDGLGRSVRAFKYDGQDPGNPYLTSDTQYDNLGRVRQVSNPYRSPGCTSAINPSGRWTTSSYDALSRVLTVTTPDNAVVSTAYSGNQVTVTDQKGKSRRSVTDALGRLTQVIEDPNGLAYQTSYSYDVLGNLSTVTQDIQHRYFMYDSLSRLIRAKNPEQDANASLALADSTSGNSQWSVGYAYDNNGNLSTRTDARGVTASYIYDNINRNITVNYSDGTHIDRIYDSATNGRGRLRGSFYYISTGANSHTAIDNYDAMGRPLYQRQHFYASGGWGTAYITQRTYDYAGHVLSQTYPSGRTVNYAYDQAGRANSFTGNLGDGVTRTYAASISYDEWNGLSREQFGTNTPLYHKERRNIRGQTYDMLLSTVNDADNYNRGAIVNYYSLQVYGRGASGPDNNGNVVIQQHRATTDDAGNYALMQDNYDYDALNRLSWMGEYQGGTTNTGGQGYSYDRYGNRTMSGWGTGINNQQFAVNTSTNRLGVPNGQAGVMQYDANGNLTTDTYSGAGGRAYDAENRMTSATNSASQQSLYTYDGDGRRVRRNSYNQEVWQAYGMDGELLAEYAANATPSLPQKEYGYRNGELLVTLTPPSPVTNLAQGKAATQVSTYDVAVASRAVDGNTNGAYYGGSVTHTLGGSQEWWQVDLGTSYSLQTIKVWNRTDCCSERLSNFYVLVSDVPFTSTDLNTTLNQAGVSSYYTAGQGGTPTAQTVNRSGRYVRVQLAAPGVLSLAEVEVLGTTLSPAVNLALNKATVQSSEAWGGVSSRAVDGNTSGNWADATVTHTNAEAGAWWQVDLGSQQSIQSINVWNRTDCCSERLTNFNVIVLDQNQNQVASFNTSGQAGTPTSISVNQVGRYVKVQLVEFNALSLAEVQVWGQGGAGGAADVEWLVSDQLGTPRMVVDQTGSLAGVKRHDYLPFGEELYAGTGGRTAQQGYSVSDGVRQKFASYERDFETNLDYAQARYYSSAQGRFTSIDPLMASARATSPQSWNRYSYVFNNPLRLIDPSGMMADASHASWEDDDDKRSGELDYQARLQHQRNARAATRAAREGDWETYNDLMDSDETLVESPAQVRIENENSKPMSHHQQEDWPVAGPYIVEHPEDWRGLPKLGDGDCVALVQNVARLPRVEFWREGPKVFGNTSIESGTVIATFVNGRYPNWKHGNHAAIYLSQDTEGIWVVDQYKSLKAIQIRHIRVKPEGTDLSNNAKAFSVVYHVSPKQRSMHR